MRLYLILFTIMTQTIARPIFAQTGYGAEIGIGASQMHFAPSSLYTSASSSPMFSIKAAGVVDFSLNNHVYIQTGLGVSKKGDVRSFAYNTNDSFHESVAQTLSLYYVDLPFNVVFKTGIQGTGRFFFGIGAIPSYIIGGINSIHASGTLSGVRYDTSTSTAVRAGKPLGGFDMGLSLKAGYEFGTGMCLDIYYIAGVNDVGLGGEIDKNRMYGVSFSYFWGKGRNINKEANELIDNSPIQ